MNILFISRSFPPLKGGMEKVAYNLYDYFSRKEQVTLIKWSGSKQWLFLVLPVFLVRSAWHLLREKIDVVYLCDGFLSVLIPFLKIFNKPVVITIHGLDITYRNKFYQALIPERIALADKIICVSRSTAGECVKRNIPREKIFVIPNGINDEFYAVPNKRELRAGIERRLDMKIGGKKVLLSVGRLVERKGIHWFIREVVPKIKAQYPDFVYLVAGKGKMAAEISSIIDNNSLRDTAVMIGEVDDEELKTLYNAADIFVMPNIPVLGDFEGFGIVILEAASCSLAIVASRIEGISDVLSDANMGVLAEPSNAENWTGEILSLLKDDNKRNEIGRRGRVEVIRTFSWPAIAEKYLAVFKETR